ncbi:hypothetical protein K402DRAFT_393023, partial [Aulographum hederae CBS 113979]
TTNTNPKTYRGSTVHHRQRRALCQVIRKGFPTLTKRSLKGISLALHHSPKLYFMETFGANSRVSSVLKF